MHKHTPRISGFFMLILISALLVACGSNTADPTISVEQAVEQTMEAIEASQPTAEQTAAASYPLPVICDRIAALLD